MSAFGGKADMTVYGNALFAVAIGAKRKCHFALHMSANDAEAGLSNHWACFGAWPVVAGLAALGALALAC